MIVECPKCNKPMSSVAPRCPACGFVPEDLSDEQREELQRRRLRDRIYHLKMTSYVAISLMLAACGWYWWESPEFTQAPGTVPVILLSLGVVGYLVTRVFLHSARKQLKKLR
ncbi:hypothetical protein F3N42_15245 [Marinihelvus fidelis]|uniref:Zinc ribbon domain-containing protein n=1 Tax=Marinihelvus fidelis TaxID=2613842 RepID=A0A5N0T398_9GAMM|nr:hypothetical protein [Marinihelvus fidelis]KAA9129550.1 hypothetical protein F3N42_15245 [Marinihelvus fidelis]